MAKEFFTEKDIEDLVKKGIISLQVTDNVVLTELAYEKANRLGMRLLTNQPANPPAAPVRPYLSQPSTPHTSAGLESAGSAPTMDHGDLAKKIHSAVISKLGNQVDPQLLDVIIQRVLKSTGVK